MKKSAYCVLGEETCFLDWVKTSEGNREEQQQVLLTLISGLETTRDYSNTHVNSLATGSLCNCIHSLQKRARSLHSPLAAAGRSTAIPSTYPICTPFRCQHTMGELAVHVAGKWRRSSWWYLFMFLPISHQKVLQTALYIWTQKVQKFKGRQIKLPYIGLWCKMPFPGFLNKQNNKKNSLFGLQNNFHYVLVMLLT